MRHEMLTQRALFCHHANTKTGTLNQHFVTHVIPPLVLYTVIQIFLSMHYFKVLTCFFICCCVFFYALAKKLSGVSPVKHLFEFPLAKF